MVKSVTLRGWAGRRSNGFTGGGHARRRGALCFTGGQNIFIGAFGRCFTGGQNIFICLRFDHSQLVFDYEQRIFDHGQSMPHRSGDLSGQTARQLG